VGFISSVARAHRFFGAASLVLIPVSLYMVFVYAPTEATGDVQRIFYYHVATAWNAFAFFAAVAVASAMYLFTRVEAWNHAARTLGELGVLFTTLTLIAGSLWARPIWNVWWTWDPRLTTTLILWFIYVAYLLVQAAGEESSRQRRIGAIVGVVGFVDIPLVHYSAILWRSIHPVVITRESAGMPAEMFVTMILSVIAFTALGLFLWGHRMEVEALAERVEVLKESVRAAEGWR